MNIMSGHVHWSSRFTSLHKLGHGWISCAVHKHVANDPGVQQVHIHKTLFVSWKELEEVNEDIAKNGLTISSAEVICLTTTDDHLVVVRSYWIIVGYWIGLLKIFYTIVLNSDPYFHSSTWRSSKSSAMHLPSPMHLSECLPHTRRSVG